MTTSRILVQALDPTEGKISPRKWLKAINHERGEPLSLSTHTHTVESRRLESPTEKKQLRKPVVIRLHCLSLMPNKCLICCQLAIGSSFCVYDVQHQSAEPLLCEYVLVKWTSPLHFDFPPKKVFFLDPFSLDPCAK